MKCLNCGEPGPCLCFYCLRAVVVVHLIEAAVAGALAWAAWIVWGG